MPGVEKKMADSDKPPRIRRRKRGPLLQVPKPTLGEQQAQKEINEARALLILNGELLPATDRELYDVNFGKFRKEFCDQARMMCKLGATDAEMADWFGVHVSTIGGWRVSFSEFDAAVDEGKNSFDGRVERALAMRAMGYSFDAVKIFLPKDTTDPVVVHYREHVPPDVTACIFWLKNRQSDRWRDVHHMRHQGTVTVQMTPDEMKY